MVSQKTISMLHPLERKVLPYLREKYLSSIISKTGLKEAEVMRAVQWLSSKGFLTYKKQESRVVKLGALGEKYLEKGLPEFVLLENLPEEETSIEDLREKTGLEKEEINVSIGILKKKGLIYTTKKDDGLFLARSEPARVYLQKYKNPLKIFKRPRDMNELSQDEYLVFKDLVKRKDILREDVKKDFILELTKEGEELLNHIEKHNINLDLIENITEDVIKKETWKEKGFRHYDVNSKVPKPDLGRRHAMIEANNILRDLFIEMGFQEMEGPLVESEFWCFDALWIPQDHPAREEQDTFYVDGHASLPKSYKDSVREMHEEGLKRAHTVKGEWSEEVASRRILRTHSTPTSFRKLAELGERRKNGEDINGKFFYVAHNFRNETIDATHLVEFFQAEGFIIGDDLSLADLMGFVKEYYSKLGVDQIKFKPTFNPYTEPSMEAHYYDPVMDKWYALINSGVFRPETLKPFGLEDKKIIAWGMGANRVAALLSGKESMREITGAGCDIEWLKYRPVMKREIVRRKED